MSKYAILGATGKVGMATSLALRDAGIPVRVIVRDVLKARLLHSAGCEIAVANMQNIDSISQAIGDADAVQIVLPPSPVAKDAHEDMLKTIECLASALERTRPKRLLAISDYGAHVSSDIGMPTVFHCLEKRLAQLGGHKLFLRSAEHMENWAPAVSMAAGSGSLSTFLDSVDVPRPTISARDVGLISAKLLQLSVDGEGTQVVHAEGPQRYSARDVAAALSELLGRPIDIAAIPRSQWKNTLEQNMSSSLAELIIKFNDAQNIDGLVEVESRSSVVRYGNTKLKEALQALLDS